MRRPTYVMDDEIYSGGRALPPPPDAPGAPSEHLPRPAAPWTGDATVVVTPPDPAHLNPDLRDMYTVVATHGACAVQVHRRAAPRAVAAALEALAAAIRRTNP